MSKLIARAKSVIKITGKTMESCDITIPKGGCVLEALNLYLPVIGISKEVSFSAPQSEWISVDDRLPCEGDYTLVVGNGVTQHQTYFHEECMVSGCRMWFCYSDEVDPVPMKDITHWMPLPSPPKES